MSPEQQDTIHYAFNEVIDTTIDELVARGLTENDALDTVFEIATELAGQELLPQFPEGDEVPIEEIGKWVVAAGDLNFIEFCVEAVSG
jgi:hypothetical protein